MTGAFERIREESRAYGEDVGGSGPAAVAAAGVFQFGIEFGLAIAVQAGSVGTEAILRELREAVYHDNDRDRDVLAQMDRSALRIAGRT